MKAEKRMGNAKPSRPHGARQDRPRPDSRPYGGSRLEAPFAITVGGRVSAHAAWRTALLCLGGGGAFANQLHRLNVDRGGDHARVGPVALKIDALDRDVGTL